MNSRLSNNKLVGCILAAAMAFCSIAPAQAGGDEDNKGLWTTFEASKKVTKRFKVGGEAEFRTADYAKEVERFALGVNGQYKINNYLKANAGYIFILGYNPESSKDKFDDNGDYEGYNLDQAYWEKRNRFYVALSGSYKIGRIELSVRERLQYTRTNSAIVDEEKHRFNISESPIYDEFGDYVFDEDGNVITIREKEEKPVKTVPELKETDHNTVLRSRLSVKWNIPKSKINPFVSTELYSRINHGWDGFDKLRSRIGASYKINKDNALEFYYLFEKAGKKGKPNTHAIGIGYSIDL